MTQFRSRLLLAFCVAIFSIVGNSAFAKKPLKETFDEVVTGSHATSLVSQSTRQVTRYGDEAVERGSFARQGANAHGGGSLATADRMHGQGSFATSGSGAKKVTTGVDATDVASPSGGAPAGARLVPKADSSKTVATANGHRHLVLSNKQARETAKTFGMKEVTGSVPSAIQRQVGANPVFLDKNTKRYLSPDKAGHRANYAWKRFDREGNRETGTLDSAGNFTKVSS